MELFSLPSSDQLQLVVGEEYQPLPLSFLSLEQRPVKEPDPGWFGSLKRKRSFKGQDSIKRKRSLKGRDAVKVPQEKDFVLKRKDSKKAKKRPKVAASEQSTSLPPPGVADVQLATLAAGQFQMNEVNTCTVSTTELLALFPFLHTSQAFLHVSLIPRLSCMSASFPGFPARPFFLLPVFPLPSPAKRR